MRLLIVKVGALGDVAMASTMLAAARRLDPQARITWLCGERVRPLVAEFAGVDEIVTVDDAALLAGNTVRRAAALAACAARLALRRFDLVVTGHSDPRYGLLSRSVLAGQRRGFGGRLPVPGRWHGDEYARLIHGLEGPLAPPARLAALKRRLPKPGPGRGRVLLVPGGARNLMRDDGLRRWPLPHYAALAQALLKRGFGVALAGSAEDAWVRPAFRKLKIEDRLGATDLPGFLDLAASSRLVVSHDTGPLHLALLASAPVLGLFGPTDPREKVPSGPRTRVLWGGERLACRPCYDGRSYAACDENRCLASVTAQDALAAARTLLGRA
jgi:heptosyltransferase-2